MTAGVARISQPGRDLPNLTAPTGSLLEMIYLANERTIVGGNLRNGRGNDPDLRARKDCLRVAESHKAALAAAKAREGLRSYVEACNRPWDGLWRQIAPVVGEPLEPPPIARHQRKKRARVLATEGNP